MKRTEVLASGSRGLAGPDPFNRRGRSKAELRRRLTVGVACNVSEHSERQVAPKASRMAVGTYEVARSEASGTNRRKGATDAAEMAR